MRPNPLIPTLIAMRPPEAKMNDAGRLEGWPHRPADVLEAISGAVAGSATPT
jgi:hypothetical protein